MQEETSWRCFTVLNESLWLEDEIDSTNQVLEFIHVRIAILFLSSTYLFERFRGCEVGERRGGIFNVRTCR